MSKIEIDFVLRSDALEKPGGDSFQVEKYTEFLERRGFDIRLVPFHSSMILRKQAIIHIVNVDRPFDFLRTVHRAGSRAVVVSSIHHDLQSVRLMRSAETGQGLRSILGRILPESIRELLAFFVRSAKKMNGFSDFRSLCLDASWAVPRAHAVWTLVGAALDSAHTVTLLAEGERASLREDTAWKGLNGILIPNGLPDTHAGLHVDWNSRPTDVCVVGRIEPRKRQLEVAVAAKRYGLRIKFVGRASPSSQRYTADFAAAVEANPDLEWCGAMPHREVLDVMRTSRVILNASWVEVQSLVDIEGASAGCWVVVGNGGNSAEWLNEALVAVDSYDIDEILIEVIEVLRKSEGPPAVVYDHTWESAAEKLEGVYLQIQH